MSLNVEGSSCARCHAYLFLEDDIVYCPICGAPHHRECYNALGHCALEELHGTDRQYSRQLVESHEEKKPKKEPQAQPELADNKVKCKMCGESYSADEGRCPKCAAPNFSRVQGFQEFDFLGGVPADYKISENVTATEAKRFVAANPQRYVPKFAVLNKKNKISWNWMAFLFPCGWLLSRKMYKSGVIAGILTVMISLFSYPFSVAINNLGIAEAKSYTELAGEIYAHLPEVGLAVMAFALIGLVLDLALRVIFALFGDYFYKNYTVAQINKIKSESQDMEHDFRKKGGVNFFLFLLGTMAVNYLTVIITMLL